jgi:hypothetical protein
MGSPSCAGRAISNKANIPARPGQRPFAELSIPGCRSGTSPVDPFAQASAANSVWCIDFKGHFRTAGRRKVPANDRRRRLQPLLPSLRGGAGDDLRRRPTGTGLRVSRVRIARLDSPVAETSTSGLTSSARWSIQARTPNAPSSSPSPAASDADPSRTPRLEGGLWTCRSVDGGPPTDLGQTRGRVCPHAHSPYCYFASLFGAGTDRNTNRGVTHVPR